MIGYFNCQYNVSNIRTATSSSVFPLATFRAHGVASPITSTTRMLSIQTRELCSYLVAPRGGCPPLPRGHCHLVNLGFDSIAQCLQLSRMDFYQDTCSRVFVSDFDSSRAKCSLPRPYYTHSRNDGRVSPEPHSTFTEGLATNEISYATRRNQLKSTEIRDRNQHLCIETRSTRRGLYSHTHYVVEIKVEIQKSTEISYAFLAVADPSTFTTVVHPH